MKKKFLSTFVFCVLVTLNLFSQQQTQTNYNNQPFSEDIVDDGTHSYETTLDFLARKLMKDEVTLYNNSSYDIKVACRIVINEKKHALKKMELLSGMLDEFDGVDDDEMHDELPHFFGSAGRISLLNKNKITFVFDFYDCNDKVVLSRFYRKGKKICFEATDK